MSKKLSIIVVMLLFIGLCVFTLIPQNPILETPAPIIANEKPTKSTKTAVAKDFVILNNKSLKYHKRDCKYGLKTKDFKIVQEKDLPKGAAPCKYCHTNHQEKSTKKTQTPKQIILPQPPLIYHSQNIKIFLTDLTTTQKPNNNCNIALCKELLTQINNTQTSIDFALYGYTKIPEIQIAIENAIKRGVQVRLVFDVDNNGQNLYPDTLPLSQIVKNHQADYGNSAIMHNKFFIFDKKIVLTGSANLSNTDMSGFNTNSVAFITSSELAELYTKEFEQMYGGNFHKTKKTHARIMEFSTYFSPQDAIITQEIIPLIKNSKKYVYIPAFLITHKGFSNALLEAHSRGVEIKIILDATNANNKSSAIKTLRAGGILVKVENYAGKVHSKSIIIDDLYTIIGSMNFSKSGESINDENLIILQDQNIAIFYKNFFNYLWSKIPNKYLTKNVRAESFDSIGSCYDGIDNNFDGKIDAQDIGCIKK